MNSVGKRVLKAGVVMAALVWLFTRPGSFETGARWVGRGMAAVQRHVIQGHTRQIATHEATIETLQRKIAELKSLRNITSSETQRVKLGKEIADCESGLVFLRSAIGQEMLDLLEIDANLSEMAAKHREELGYTKVAISPEFAEQLAEMQATILRLERQIELLASQREEKRDFST